MTGFQFPISLQIEVNRGAQRLNKDIAASDRSTSAQHPVHQQVTIKGFGTDFNLVEMKTVREKKKKLKRVHQTTHLIPLKASAQSRKWLYGKKKKIVHHQQLCFKVFYLFKGQSQTQQPFSNKNHQLALNSEKKIWSMMKTGVLL